MLRLRELIEDVELPLAKFLQKYQSPFLIELEKFSSEMVQSSSYQITSSKVSIPSKGGFSLEHIADGLDAAAYPVSQQNPTDSKQSTLITLGSGDDNDIVISYFMVDEVQAKIAFHPASNKYLIKNAGTLSKIYLNDKELTTNKAMELNENDILLLGERHQYLFCLPEDLHQIVSSLASRLEGPAPISGDGAAIAKTTSAAGEAEGGEDELEEDGSPSLEMSPDEVLIHELMNADKFQEAVQMMVIQEADIGYDLILKLPLDEHTQKNLGRLLVKARDFYKAALVYYRLGDHERAAELFALAGEPHSAADIYFELKQWERAAFYYEMAEKYRDAARACLESGNINRAADNFVKEIDRFLARSFFISSSARDESDRSEPEIIEAENNFLKFVSDYVEKLAEGEKVRQVLNKYLAVLRMVKIRSRNLDFFYGAAEVLSHHNLFMEAKEILDRINEVDSDFTRITETLSAVEERESQNPLGRLAFQALPHSEIIEFLQEVPLFEQFSMAELRLFHAVSQIRSYKQDAVVMEQHSPASGLFIVMSGSLEVVRIDEGRKRILDRVYSKGIVGEISLTYGGVTAARVVAEVDCELIRISATELLELMELNVHLKSKMYLALLRLITQRLNKTMKQLLKSSASKPKAATK